MNDLIFVRHAETNMAGTFCGQIDPPVNAAGRGQIAALVASLKDELLDTIYSSDLERATETAKIFAASKSIPYIVRAGLREIGFGKWEGLTWKEVEMLDGAYARRWLEAYPTLPVPEGELFSDFELRVQAEIHFLQRQSISRRIAVVTHAGVLRSILCRHCGTTDAEAWSKTKVYCSSFRLSYQLQGAKQAPS